MRFRSSKISINICASQKRSEMVPKKRVFKKDANKRCFVRKCRKQTRKSEPGVCTLHNKLTPFLMWPRSDSLLAGQMPDDESWTWQVMNLYSPVQAIACCNTSAERDDSIHTCKQEIVYWSNLEAKPQFGESARPSDGGHNWRL